ncbi:hypothetical protein SALBM311S_02386 [Streptomyces alboniger]
MAPPNPTKRRESAVDDHRSEGPGENGEPVPRDLPDQQAHDGEDPWEVGAGSARGDTIDTTEPDDSENPDEAAADVPDTDESGTGRRGAPPAGRHRPRAPGTGRTHGLTGRPRRCDRRAALRGILTACPYRHGPPPGSADLVALHRLRPRPRPAAYRAGTPPAPPPPCGPGASAVPSGHGCSPSAEASSTASKRWGEAGSRCSPHAAATAERTAVRGSRTGRAPSISPSRPPSTVGSPARLKAPRTSERRARRYAFAASSVCSACTRRPEQGGRLSAKRSTGLQPDDRPCGQKVRPGDTVPSAPTVCSTDNHPWVFRGSSRTGVIRVTARQRLEQSRCPEQPWRPERPRHPERGPEVLGQGLRDRPSRRPACGTCRRA